MPELSLKEDGEGERGPLELAVSMWPKGPAESPGWLSSRFPKKKDTELERLRNCPGPVSCLLRHVLH